MLKKKRTVKVQEFKTPEAQALPESWTEVMNHVWGEPTASPRVDPSSGKTLMPVLCGEGACTICFKKTQQASDYKSLPFQQISDAGTDALDAVLDVAVKIFG